MAEDDKAIISLMKFEKTQQEIEFEETQKALDAFPSDYLVTLAYKKERVLESLREEFALAMREEKMALDITKDILLKRMIAEGSSIIPHDKLIAEKVESSQPRLKNVSELKRISEDNPGIDWSEAIYIEQPKPVVPEVKVDLRKLDIIIRKLGDSELGKTLKHATRRPPGVVSLSIRPREDVMQNVTNAQEMIG